MISSHLTYLTNSRVSAVTHTFMFSYISATMVVVAMLSRRPGEGFKFIAFQNKCVLFLGYPSLHNTKSSLLHHPPWPGLACLESSGLARDGTLCLALMSVSLSNRYGQGRQGTSSPRVWLWVPRDSTPVVNWSPAQCKHWSPLVFTHLPTAQYVTVFY
jgi:hypothetical protein